MDKVVYKKKVVEQYELRNEGEWAFITLDSNNGLFQSNSSFGNYSYSWPNHGRESFKSFLIEIDYDYFLNKVSNMNEVDGIKTKEKWTKAILEDRKDRVLDMYEARKAYDSLQTIDFSASMDSIWDQFYYSFLGDIYDCMDFDLEVDFPIQARMFWEKIMKPFRKILKEELNLI